MKKQPNTSPTLQNVLFAEAHNNLIEKAVYAHAKEVYKNLQKNNEFPFTRETFNKATEGIEGGYSGEATFNAFRFTGFIYPQRVNEILLYNMVITPHERMIILTSFQSAVGELKANYTKIVNSKKASEEEKKQAFQNCENMISIERYIHSALLVLSKINARRIKKTTP